MSPEKITMLLTVKDHMADYYSLLGLWLEIAPKHLLVHLHLLFPPLLQLQVTLLQPSWHLLVGTLR